MSRSKFNPLITASVMSAVYLAGISNVSQAVVLDDVVTDNLSPVVAYETGSAMSVVPAANSMGQHRYIIQLSGPAIARFEGNADFDAMPRRPGNKLDVNSAQVQAYLSHLETDQTELLDTISNALGRNVELIQAFQFAYNGIAVYLTPNEVETVENTAGISRVILDRDYFLTTDAGPKLIGANNLWGVDGVPSPDIIFKTGFEVVVQGEFGAGVVIGTLDTGANFDHPSFAEVGGDGYVHVNPLGAGNFLGVCDSGNTSQYIATYTCNNKIIGGYDFVNGLEPVDGFDIPGPEDENGHGSHTASTSGGNMLATAEALGVTDIQISGVAPHATVMMFDVCYNNAAGQGACPGVSSIASIDQAIADGLVDVVNFSIGGGVSPWLDPVSEAFLNATASGIFVATSAGNSGPLPGTLGHVEPWTSSSGASTHNRRFSNAMTVTGPDPVPANLVGALAVQGTGPIMVADMVGTMEYAGNIDGGANVTACVAFTDPLTGLIAVISRGGCSFADKVNNAVGAGAVGVIVHNNVPGDPIVMGALAATTVPSVMVALDIGLALDAFIDANPGAATVSVSSDTSISLDGLADSMASFSSRGPSPFEYNKPDVTGPGVSILAAFNDDDPVGTGTPAEYGVISGTSMSSPHNAGAAALLRGMKPGWSAPEIKSALMMTAVTAGVTKEDGLTAADPFDRGAGRIQVDTAAKAGLVMDETALNFAFADPDNGGDPTTLNVPSITDYKCVETCTFQRGFRSVASVPVTYGASVVGLPGTVTPATFSLNPGQFVVLNVEVDGLSLPIGANSFGELVIAEQAVFTAVPFTAVPADTNIPDDLYDGTLATMLCETIDVSGITSDSFSASLDLSMTHSWVGDLTIKLQNPNGDILGVMSRPDFVESADDGTGCCGSNSNFADTDPISFFDGAAVSAENMPAGFADVNICTDDGICDYAPAPDTVANPPVTFADLGVGTANGNWNICVGDSGGGDTGVLSSITLNVLEGAELNVPTLHLPMVIVGFPPEPEIDVTPTSLTQSQDPDTTNDQVINIANTPAGGADLNWTITEGIMAFDYVNKVQSTNSGFSSAQFTPDNAGEYEADDMVLSANASIDQLSFLGFVLNGQTIADIATAVEVRIYADVAGEPAGNPDEVVDTALFTLNLPVGDANLDLTDNNITFNVNAALGDSLEMGPGLYWITVFPILSDAFGTNDRWNWFSGLTSNDVDSLFIDPSDLFAAGATSWTDLATFLSFPPIAGLAYSASGDLTCGATWLSVDITSNPGGTAVGDSDDVIVTFDSTGLAPGDYTANICINSDDADEALTFVAVNLTVNVVP